MLPGLLDDERKKLNGNQLLNKLEDHIYDVTSYMRLMNKARSNDLLQEVNEKKKAKLDAKVIFYLYNKSRISVVPLVIPNQL